MYKSITKILMSSCTDSSENIHISTLYGSRFNGIKLGRRMGIPTVNIWTDKEIKCGIYDATSDYGPATVIIGKNDRKKAFVNFTNYTPEMDKVERFKFWNLNRIINKDSEFVNTYNRGCC